MKEYKTEKALVRIHGTVDRERIEAASTTFMKKVIRRKKDKK